MSTRRPEARSNTRGAARKNSGSRATHVPLYNQRARSAKSAPSAARGQKRIASSRSRSSASARPRKSVAPKRRQQRRAKQRKNFKFLRYLAGTFILVFALVWIRGCFFGGPNTSVNTDPEDTVLKAKWAGVHDSYSLFESAYDYSGLDTTQSLFSFHQSGISAAKGIDVSEHNGDIDWQKVKAAGIDFAYLRLGYRGTSVSNIAKDAKFDKNLEEASAAGLKLGVYFFSQATNENEAKEEAQYVLDTLNNMDLSYPVAFDFEPKQDGTDRISGLSQEEKTAVATAFCEAINEGGYNAIIYGNQHDLRLYNLTELAKWGFWYAEYDTEPTYTIKYGIWQYSSTGTVDGIKGDVDLNLDAIDILRSEQN